MGTHPIFESDFDCLTAFRMEQENEKLDVKQKPDIAAKLSMITRKKPNFTKIEQSSILSRVKAFMPELKKGEVDLWQEIKNKGDESVNVEQLESDEKAVDVEFAIVPSEVIISDSDDSSSDESEMDDDERRIFDLINLKLNGAPSTPDNDSGVSSITNDKRLIEELMEE